MKEGKWYPVSERLSRWVRIQLLETLLERMDRKEIARACDVTVQAVSNWIHKRNEHPGNECSKTLLKFTLAVDSKGAEKIVRKDIGRYLKELKEIGMEISLTPGNLITQKN